MAFNFLNRLRNQFAQDEFVDQNSPVFEEEGDIDDESDVEFAQGGEEKEEEESTNNVYLDLASESDPHPNNPNNPFPWSTTLHDVELFTRRTGPNLDLLILTTLQISLISSTYTSLTLAAEQTNLYASQTTGAQTLFKPVTVDDISKYFYINMMFGIHKLPSYIFAMKCALPNFMRMCLTVKKENK